MTLTVLHHLEQEHTKVGGNYAASLFSGQRAAQEGFSNCMYLDAIHKKIY